MRFILRLWSNAPYVAFVGIIAIVAVGLLGILCSPSSPFGEVCQVSSNTSLWVGALLGAITTALFFNMIELRVSRMSRRSEAKQSNDRRWGVRFHRQLGTIAYSVFFVGLIAGGALLVMYAICPPNFPFVDACQVSAGTSIWLGALLGAVTTALFFYMIERRVSTVLEDYARAYIVRTCFFNLKDVFAPSKAKEARRLIPNEENRQYFLKILDEQYLQEFDVKAGEVVREIYDLALGHQKIVEDDPNHETCAVCGGEEGLIKKLQGYIDGNPNPIEKGVKKYPKVTRG